MGKWKRANLENSVTVQKPPPEMRYKKAFLKLDEMGQDIIIFYIYLFHFGIIIFVFYPEAIVRRCSLKRCS